MVRRSLVLLAATFLASCGGGQDHPFDRVGRSLAEPVTPALKELQGAPAGDATAAAAGSQAAPAGDAQQVRRDAEALAQKHGFDGVDDYRATYERMRLWKDFLGKQDRRPGARADLKGASERATAALAGPALPPAERDRYQTLIRTAEEDRVRLDAEEKLPAPGDDDERRAYERNRKAFEAADKRR